MVTLSSNITIGEYTLAGVVSVSIVSTWESLTDTCKIMLPSSILHKDKRISLAESQLIKRGDKVLVELGYDGENKTVFQGFVKKVNAGSPVSVECEDYAFLLKQDALNLSFRTVTLKALIQAIVPSEIDVVTDNVGLGAFRISNATAAKVLEQLKKQYGLKAFFKGSTLFVGRAYPVVPLETKNFEFQKNIIKDALTYQLEDTIKIKAKGISILPNNSKIELEIGDPNGEQRTFNFYNLQKDDLKKALEAELEGVRYSGYKGSFTTFGRPLVAHGDVVKITDDRYNRQGEYYVRKVVYDFGQNGYRQNITLDRLFD